MNAIEVFIGTYLVVRYVINGNRTDQAGNGADAVRHAHQNAGVARCDVQVVDVVAGYGEPAEGDTERERRQRTRLRCAQIVLNVNSTKTEPRINELTDVVALATTRKNSPSRPKPPQLNSLRTFVVLM